MEKINLLGIPIDVISLKQATDDILLYLNENKQKHIATPNNEMLVESTKNSEFKSVLQNTDLNLPDSTGLLIAAFLTGQKLHKRCPGVDTVIELCKRLKPDQPVFLLGAAPGIAQKAAAKLNQINPGINIGGYYSGSPQDSESDFIVNKINHSKPQLLLVAYGAPAQDLWINKHLNKIPSVRVAMGVGGTFDFLAGNIKRAPEAIRQIGLEWLWRLIIQPRRLTRIINATVVFLYLVIRYGKKY